MEKLVEQCLTLIISDDVDQVVWALDRSYFWILKNIKAGEQSQNALQQFINKVSQTLIQKKYSRQSVINGEKAERYFRDHETIAESIIQQFLKRLTSEESILLLGELVGAYALSVPEPFFRAANTFKSLHKTADIPSINDNLPMTDEMILYAWQYHWFYTWLGY